MKLCLRITLLLLLVSGTLQQGFDLGDALDSTETPKQPKITEKPKNDGELDLSDAYRPDEPATTKPKKPSSGDSGGGSFGDSDLIDIGGGYQPDPGHPNSGGGGHSGSDSYDGADQPQEAGSGKIAGIVSAIGVALLGAASSYFAYQKKKLCFKIQGGVDPEKGHQGTQSDPQVFSNLLRTS